MHLAPPKLCAHADHVEHVQVTEASTVVLSVPTAPSVKLDDKYYKLVDKMEALTEAPPSLKDAKSLTVKGPVLFRKGCVFQGDTLVVNGAPRQAWLECPEGPQPHHPHACMA